MNLPHFLVVAYGWFLTTSASGLIVQPASQVGSTFFNYTLVSLVPSPVGAQAQDGAGPEARLGVHEGELGGQQRFGAVGLWTCVVAVVLIVLAHALLCYGLIWCRDSGTRESAQPKKAEASKGRPVSYLCRQAPRSAADSASNLASNSHLSVSVLGQDEATPRGQSRSGSTAGHVITPPLCPQLVVPDRSKLQCVLQDKVHFKRQNACVNVCSVAARGGTPLFQARINEVDVAASSAVGIYLETLRGEEKFAFLSTQEVWNCPEKRQPSMDIMRASGSKYASMAKNDVGAYSVTSGGSPLMTFSGSFSKHDIRVSDGNGQTLAEVSPGSTEGTYEVVVFPNVDAGLIILGLLAINKTERVAASRPPSAR
jgi:hypothetical protein